jgi:predicted TIM-barrel fold metal-dependent hydrolase
MSARATGAEAGTGPLDRPAALIDCDVHVAWERVDELLPYVPRQWHGRLLHGAGHTPAGVRLRPQFWVPGRGLHKEAAPAPAGGPPGSDPTTVARDWLDRHGIAYAVLNHYDAPVVSTWGDVDYPAAVAAAHNTWLIERWLSRDRRFLGSVVVATQDPAAAAREIDRVGAHPQVVQVLLASGARLPYGARHYAPIYAAAERHGLTLAVHAGSEGEGTSCPPSAAGWPTSYLEWRACQPQSLAAHLTSLVTEGVFVRFPRLRCVFLEGGVAWLAPFLWRLDKNFKGLRSEVPWLTELPSAHVRRHFRFGTQGAELPAAPEGARAEAARRSLWLYLDELGAADVLVYAGNYPRWDLEAPDDAPVLRTAAGAVRHRIAYENARQLYANKLPPDAGPPQVR